jgi:hypothetical protein
MSEVSSEIKNTVDKLNKQLNEHYEKIYIILLTKIM